MRSGGATPRANPSPERKRRSSPIAASSNQSTRMPAMSRSARRKRSPYTWSYYSDTEHLNITNCSEYDRHESKIVHVFRYLVSE
jgi:hypothetical protein